MSKPAFENLAEFFQEIDNYHGGWDAYKEKFFSYPKDNRIIELSAYDKLLEQELAPTRQTAEYISKRRILGDIDNLLRRAGR
jgi:hypothetical protein